MFYSSCGLFVMLSGLIADAFGALDDSGYVLSSLMGSDGVVLLMDQRRGWLGG